MRIGTWTTYYFPGVSNGFGANISVPAQALDGKVIAPGANFDFWRDIGPVTVERGYRYGGAIINGRSEPTGRVRGRHLLGLDHHVQRRAPRRTADG